MYIKDFNSRSKDAQATGLSPIIQTNPHIEMPLPLRNLR